MLLDEIITRMILVVISSSVERRGTNFRNIFHNNKWHNFMDHFTFYISLIFNALQQKIDYQTNTHIKMLIRLNISKLTI